jgi:hypothetical protein
MPPPANLTFTQMARFEAAIDTLNQHMGSCQARIHQEQRQAQPNADTITHWRHRAKEFSQHRTHLHPADLESTNRILHDASRTAAELRG